MNDASTQYEPPDTSKLPQQLLKEEFEWELGRRADVPVKSWNDAVVRNRMVSICEGRLQL